MPTEQSWPPEIGAVLRFTSDSKALRASAIDPWLINTPCIVVDVEPSINIVVVRDMNYNLWAVEQNDVGADKSA
jgi:hypothetical protein